MYVAIWHWLRNSASEPVHQEVADALPATSVGLTAITTIDAVEARPRAVTR